MDPATATLIASGITAGGNLFSQVHTNQANRQSEQDARAFNVRQQELMNQYNSPVQQVQRLRAAGLNPALAYGANGEVIGNQSAPVVGNPVVNSAPQADYSGVISSALAVREQQNRNNLADSEVALKNAYTLSETFRQAKYDIDTQLGRENLRQLIAFMNPRLNNLLADTALKYSQSELNQKQKEFTDSRIKLSESEKSKLDVETRQIVELLPYTVKKMNAETAMLYMQSKKFEQDIELAWEYLNNDEVRASAYAESIGLQNRQFERHKQEFDATMEFNKAKSIMDATQRNQEMKFHFVSDMMRCITTLATGGLMSMPQTITRTSWENDYAPERTVVKGFGK